MKLLNELFNFVVLTSKLYQIDIHPPLNNEKNIKDVLFRLYRTRKKVTKHGKILNIELIISPVYNKNGENFDLIGLLWISHNLDMDISIPIHNIKHIFVYDGIEEVIQQTNSNPSSKLNLKFTIPTYPYNIIWVNSNWTSLFGYALDEVINVPWPFFQQWALFDSYNIKENKLSDDAFMKELDSSLGIWKNKY